MADQQCPINGGMCEGCGHYHGSLNKRLECLTAALREARAKEQRNFAKEAEAAYGPARK